MNLEAAIAQSMLMRIKPIPSPNLKSVHRHHLEKNKLFKTKFTNFIFKSLKALGST